MELWCNHTESLSSVHAHLSTVVLLHRFDRLVYLGISEEVESKVKILKAICRK